MLVPWIQVVSVPVAPDWALAHSLTICLYQSPSLALPPFLLFHLPPSLSAALSNSVSPSLLAVCRLAPTTHSAEKLVCPCGRIPDWPVTLLVPVWNWLKIDPRTDLELVKTSSLSLTVPLLYLRNAAAPRRLMFGMCAKIERLDFSKVPQPFCLFFTTVQTELCKKYWVFVRHYVYRLRTS